MLLPEMVTRGPDHRRRSSQQRRGEGQSGGFLDGNRAEGMHVVMAARSGGWAASGQAGKVLPHGIEEE
jgi:hypothetical protein